MTATIEEMWETIGPISHEISNRFGGKYRHLGAEWADFHQEHFIWAMQSLEMLNEKHAELEPRDFERFVARCFENESKDYARDIRAQHSGYHREDEAFYSRGELEHLLDCVFDAQAWLNPPQSEGRSTKAPAEGNNWVTTLADVKAGFAKLESEDQVLLRAFHQEGLSNKEIAEALEITEALCSYRHHRAVRRLSDHLGGEKPRPERAGDQYDPWRGRHAVSNRQAGAMTQATYDED